jgi:hypothetical protein
VKISQVEDSLNFKERLNDGNLWFYAFFSFQWLCSLAVTEDLNLNLIIFKMFFFGVRWRVFKRKTQAYVALGVNLFYAE